MTGEEIRAAVDKLRGTNYYIEPMSIHPKTYALAEQAGFIVDGRLDWDKLIAALSPEEMKQVINSMGIHLEY